MKLLRWVGIIFSILLIAVYSYVSLLMYRGSDGFYKGGEVGILVVEFYVHLTLVVNIFICILYFLDRKKLKTIPTFSESDLDDILDLNNNEKDGVHSLSRSNFLIRFILSIVPFAITVIIILVLLFVIIDYKNLSTADSKENLLGLGILGLLACGNLIPVIYLFKLKRVSRHLQDVS